MRSLLWVVGVALWLPACSSDLACSAEDLRSDLADAEAGDTVEMGACEITGSFSVKAGVKLAGQGRGQSVLIGPGGQVALTLEAGSPPTTLEALSVRSAGPAAVVVRGAGEANMTAVDVLATLGVGVGVEGVSSFTMSDVAVTGPVTTPDTASSSTDASSYGLVLYYAGTAALTSVSVTGFARIGVLALDTALTWNGGGASANAGTGLYVKGSAPAMLGGLELSRTMQGSATDALGVLIPPYAGVFTGDAAMPTTVESTGLHVDDNDGTGLLHVGAAAKHTGLLASGNGANDAVVGGPALWAQDTPSFELAGATLSDNALGGLFVVNSAYVTASVTVTDSQITATRMVERPLGDAGALVTLGDGVELVRATTAVHFTNVTIQGAERAGLLIDLGEADVIPFLMERLWSPVTVDATGSAFGAVCEGEVPKEVWGPDLPPEDSTWDDGIVRQGTAAANDAALNPVNMVSAMPLDTAGVVNPCQVPSPELGGLGALGVP